MHFYPLHKAFTPLEVRRQRRQPRLRRGLLTGFTLLILSLFLFLGTSFAKNPPLFQGEVNADNINIRSDSTSSAQVICAVNRNERLDVILELYDWYKIRLPKNSPSYVKKDLTECFNFEQNSKTCLNAKILRDRVNVRLRPSESSPIIGKVSKDEVINVLMDTGNWLKIEPVANSSGWIHKKFVNKVSAQEKSVKPSPPAIETTIHSEVETGSKGITVEGVIKPYGKIINRIATHKLVTSDNKIYLLRGNKQGLDALNYHRVKIMGEIIEAQRERYLVIEVKILVALD